MIFPEELVEEFINEGIDFIQILNIKDYSDAIIFLDRFLEEVSTRIVLTLQEKENIKEIRETILDKMDEF